MLDVRSAMSDDCRNLAPRLRKADVEEMAAATGYEPEAGLIQGYALSMECWSVVDDAGLVHAMFGVASDGSGNGVPWMMGSDALVTTHRYEFLRRSRKWVKRINYRYPVLWNFVDARNTVHIDWLIWCGFSLGKREDAYGVAKIPFYHFSKVYKPCALRSSLQRQH